MEGKTWIKKLKSFQDVYAAIEENITTAVFILMCVALIIQISCRFVFKLSVPWSEELIRYSFIAVSFIGAGCVLKSGTHIEVDLFSSLFEKIKDEKKKNALIEIKEIIKFVLVLGISAIIFKLCLAQTNIALVQHSATPAMKIPMFIIDGIIVYGFLSMMIHSLIKLIIIFGSKGKSIKGGNL